MTTFPPTIDVVGAAGVNGLEPLNKRSSEL
jgi:hypothetical protein